MRSAQIAVSVIHDGICREILGDTIHTERLVSSEMIKDRPPRFDLLNERVDCLQLLCSVRKMTAKYEFEMIPVFFVHRDHKVGWTRAISITTVRGNHSVLT